MQFRPRSASGFIVAGGTAQVLMPANPGRMGWWLQNTSADNLWINDAGEGHPASVPNSGTLCDAFCVVAGATYVSPAATQAVISIFGTASGQTFSAREW